MQAGQAAPELLFLGEPPREGYVEGALRTAFRLMKVPSRQAFGGSEAEARLGDFAVIVLSDYPSARLSDAQQERIAEFVELSGHGLLMIGGWASFGGPLGSYYGSRIAALLPVEIRAADDRTNTPTGTVLVPRREPHPAIASIQMAEERCSVVGFNAVGRRDGAAVLVEGYTVHVDAELRPRLERTETPMLSVWQRGGGRVAALAPDVMPHWAGGIVDWGTRRVTLPTGNEVGHLYPSFLVDLCRWLAGLS